MDPFCAQRIGIRNVALASPEFSANRSILPWTLKISTPTAKPPPCDNSRPHPTSKKRLVTLNCREPEPADDFDEIVDVLHARICRASHSRRDQRTRAEQRGARDRRHDVQAGVAIRGDAGRRGDGRAQHRAASRHNLRRQPPEELAAVQRPARRQALRLDDDVVQPDRLAGLPARRRLQVVPARHARPARTRCPCASAMSRSSDTRAAARRGPGRRCAKPARRSSISKRSPRIADRCSAHCPARRSRRRRASIRRSSACCAASTPRGPCSS